MNGRGGSPAAELYSPQRRTALVLSGVGTAGAYHAGVLRALHEAGVKVDLVAGRGVGVVGVLFAAVDSAQRLWDEKGFWRAEAVRGFYPWRSSLQLVAYAIALAVAVVVLPLVAVALGLIVFPIDFLITIVGLSSDHGLTSWYLRLAEAAFAGPALPTWLPRLALLILGVAAVVAVSTAWLGRDPRHRRGPFWWGIAPAP